jgi:hypothetical protein
MDEKSLGFRDHCRASKLYDPTSTAWKEDVRKILEYTLENIGRAHGGNPRQEMARFLFRSTVLYVMSGNLDIGFEKLLCASAPGRRSRANCRTYCWIAAKIKMDCS